MQKLTLSDFLTHKNETIRRNAMSIQKQLIKETVHKNIETIECEQCGELNKITRDIKGNIVPEECNFCR